MVGLQEFNDYLGAPISKGRCHYKFFDDIMEKFTILWWERGFLRMSHAISLSMSMCLKTANEIVEMIRVPYASAIGSVMYGMLCTRPDIAYAVSITSRYSLTPAKCIGKP